MAKVTIILISAALLVLTACTSSDDVDVRRQIDEGVATALAAVPTVTPSPYSYAPADGHAAARSDAACLAPDPDTRFSSSDFYATAHTYPTVNPDASTHRHSGCDSASSYSSDLPDSAAHAYSGAHAHPPADGDPT